MDSRVFKRYHFSCIMFWSLKHRLQGYVDVDMEGDKDNKRRTTGYVFTVAGIKTSWISKLQKVVSLSIMEA